MQEKNMWMNPPIPDTLLNHHLIALGKTRSGKSSKLRVLVETLLHLGKPVCIIDPKGDWIGLKSSADGKSPGFPVVIFGGEHADVPINAQSGSAVAELVATGNRPTLIDLGGWTVADRTRFFIDFAATLFKTSKGMRHLVIDEVHNFAPQGKVMDPQAGMMLHWANRLASEGAGKGITIFAASQRPQKVHKDFLTSCETLIACKVIHKLDREAIKDWIDGCADGTLGKQVIAELAQLTKPQAWVWCPEIGFGPEKVTFSLFSTFDSFKPRHDDAVALLGWAEVDLEEVKWKLASVVQEAEANDPKALRARITQLERELNAAKAVVAAPNEAALLVAERRGTEVGIEAGMCRVFTAIEFLAEQMLNKEAKPVAGLDLGDPKGDTGVETIIAPKLTRHLSNPSLHVMAKKRIDAFEEMGKQGVVDSHLQTSANWKLEETELASPPKTFNRAATPTTISAVYGSSNASDLTSPEQRVLNACAWVEVTIGDPNCKQTMVAFVAEYSLTASSFKNPKSSLHKKGLIEYPTPGLMRLTPAGDKLAVWPNKPLTHEELHFKVLNRLDGPEQRLLRPLIEVYPHFLSCEDLAKRANYSVEASSFKNPRSKLKSLGLIEYPHTGMSIASADLFP